MALPAVNAVILVLIHFLQKLKGCQFITTLLKLVLPIYLEVSAVSSI